MTKIDVLKSEDCSKIEELNLDVDLNSLEYNETTIYRVINAIYSNMNRVRYSHYKNVSGLVGSTRKMRPQKRTGKSRQGSIREIQMRGGAVKFGFSGDKEKDIGRRFRAYKFINKKESKLARLQILANKFQFSKLFVMDSFNEINKTKLACKWISELSLKKPLIVFGKNGISKAYNNVKDISISNVENLNAYKMLRSTEIIFDKNSIISFMQKINK